MTDSLTSQPDDSHPDGLDADTIQRLTEGDEELLAELFSTHRPRLTRMVRFRMDRRLAARIDAEDVLQEAFLNALARIDHYLKDSTQSLFIWFRLIVTQTLVDVHRRHLAASRRDAGRDVSLGQAGSPATSVAMAAELLGNLTSPSRAALRAEVSEQLEKALAEIPQLDQEILALRHFEELTNKEVAQVLNLKPTTTSNRYIRALARLKTVLQTIPGFFENSTGDV